MYGTILTLNNFDTQPFLWTGPGIYFIHSAALPGVYLSPCVCMNLSLIWINTVMLFKKCLKITHLNKLELLQVLHTIYHNLNTYCATTCFKLHEMGSTILCTLLTHTLFQFVDSFSRVYGLNSFKEFEASI